MAKKGTLRAIGTVITLLVGAAACAQAPLFLYGEKLRVPVSSAGTLYAYSDGTDGWPARPSLLVPRTDRDSEAYFDLEGFTVAFSIEGQRVILRNTCSRDGGLRADLTLENTAASSLGRRWVASVGSAGPLRLRQEVSVRRTDQFARILVRFENADASVMTDLCYMRMLSRGLYYPAIPAELLEPAGILYTDWAARLILRTHEPGAVGVILKEPPEDPADLPPDPASDHPGTAILVFRLGNLAPGESREISLGYAVGRAAGDVR